MINNNNKLIGGAYGGGSGARWRIGGCLQYFFNLNNINMSLVVLRHMRH
jgi:hypothetical protein